MALRFNPVSTSLSPPLPPPLRTQIEDPNAQSQPSQEHFDAFTSTKVADLAKPLKELGFPYKIHIVKDHDMSCD
ncbi:hypothetical protein ARALYDRAFT_901359 [Arabidopsis lyrata subsp. lyrata]|uniref:Uncharacterized protein n=1 Tax=Arabidopsis lyrata subsp. lyrata TaxID=81972 RepID=D7LCU9_ARALL|nr:hypothetical protein ARALYDRAFT_901359 [Arabidopsis lyrata subsp. lyrata]